MEFTVESVTPAKTVLRATRSYGFFFVLLKILGYAALALGLLLILGEPGGAAWQVTMGLGLFFWGASHAIRGLQQYLPGRLEFDNDLAMLRVFQHSATGEKPGVEIPYARLNRFLTTHQYDDGIQYFRTALEFANGSLWMLNSRGNEKSADALTDELTRAIALSNRGEDTPVQLPRGVRSANNSTTFLWQFDFFSRRNIPSFAAVFGFIWAMLAAVAAGDSGGKIAVFIFAAVIFGAVAYFGIRWIGAEGCLEIDGNEVRYFEKRGFKKRLRHSIPLGELDRVLCGAGASGGDTAIYLVRPAEFKELRKIDAGDVGIGGVADAFGLMRRVFKIYTPTLNLSERYKFAAVIEAAVGAAKK